MSDDLQFAALHSDDALLDALAGRVPGASLGVVAGVEPSATGDVAARLLAAFAEEIDTRPGPLTALLTTSAVGGSDRALAAIDPEPAPVVTPIAAARRRRRLAMSRTASIVTAGALVLGFSGVAAAIHGNAGPFENLRRAMGSMTGSSPATTNPAKRAQQLLESAEQAMLNGDMNAAADRLAQVQNLLPMISDPDVVNTLRARLDALRKRWAAIEPALAALMTHNGKTSPSMAGSPTGTSDPRSTYAPPTNSGKAPQTLVPGTSVVSDPTENMPSVNNSPVGEAKNDLKDRAKQHLGHPLPSQAPLPAQKKQPVPAPSDLPAPVGGMRGPTGSPLARQLPAWTLLYNYGGDALSKPDPTSVAGSLSSGGQH
jgi:hypothetical protein